jgi:hypothetical protein
MTGKNVEIFENECFGISKPERVVAYRQSKNKYLMAT